MLAFKIFSSFWNAAVLIFKQSSLFVFLCDFFQLLTQQVVFHLKSDKFNLTFSSRILLPFLSLYHLSCEFLCYLFWHTAEITNRFHRVCQVYSLAQIFIQCLLCTRHRARHDCHRQMLRGYWSRIWSHSVGKRTDGIPDGTVGKAGRREMCGTAAQGWGLCPPFALCDINSRFIEKRILWSRICSTMLKTANV